MDLLPRLPGRMIGTVETLVSPAAWRAANSARFAPERFEQYKLQRELVAELTRRRGRSIRVFALTDDPILYLLSGQPPTWHANLYNGSPVYEQERIIDELRTHPPDFVVALRGRVVFDGMPLNVRVPDVLSYVIAEYVPESPVDDWVVLRPRQPGEAVSPAFWRDLLGETLDLGMLPARLAAREDTACSAGRLCDEVLLLDWLNPGRSGDGGPAGPVDIRMDVDGVAATIRVRLVSGQRRYVLPLSRVWPAVAARAAGANFVAMPPPEIALTWAQWGRPPSQLY
jgi:hypothetical protein